MAEKVDEGQHRAGNAGGSKPEETFSKIGATLPPGIWILDTDGNQFSGSRMAIAELKALSGDALKTGWKEVSRRGEDGMPTTMLVTSTPLRGQSGEIEAGLAINVDITEKKKVESELRRRSEDLARSNAMLEQFARVASHDLQEPLRAIACYLELLKIDNQEVLDDKSKSYIDSSVSAATRMSNMINDLLTCSKIEAMTRPISEGDTARALLKAIENLKAVIDGSQADITFDPLPTVVADENQVTMLFQNLISNAIKYRGQAPPRIHVSAKKPGEDWQFSVKDNGIGIDPKDQEKIFKMFQRLHSKAERPGTGMGLTICRAIVRRHGGRIWVESEPGKGSTFFFTMSSRETPESVRPPG